MNGPDRQPSAEAKVEADPALSEEIRLAVLSVRERYRAVTCEDFEWLATDGFNLWLAGLQQKEQKSEPLDEWWQVTGLDALISGIPRRMLGRVNAPIVWRSATSTLAAKWHAPSPAGSSECDDRLCQRKFWRDWGLGPQPDGALALYRRMS